MGKILRWRLMLFKLSGASVEVHEAFLDESELVPTYENTEPCIDQISSLLEFECRECSRLLYDDLMLGSKVFGG